MIRFIIQRTPALKNAFRRYATNNTNMNPSNNPWMTEDNPAIVLAAAGLMFAGMYYYVRRHPERFPRGGTDPVFDQAPANENDMDIDTEKAAEGLRNTPAARRR